jgi:AcrR family transcriptional regulator
MATVRPDTGDAAAPGEGETTGAGAKRVRAGAAARGEESRRRILDAAQTLFAERGFDATPTKTIAERAAVPNGLVFYHFPTKDALLVALVAERGVLPELRAALAAWPHADLRVALADVGHRFLRALDERAELAVILFREFHTHPDIAARFLKIRAEGVAAVAEFLDQAVLDRRLRPVDTRTLASVFLSHLLFAAFLERPPEPDRVVDATVALLLQGRLPPPAP